MAVNKAVEQTVREAWVSLPSEAEIRAQMRPGMKYPYDFGFLPAMGRLLRAHERIGSAFLGLFRQIMWEPIGHLDRREREMIAAVAAAAQDCHY
jgi:hypothetical protein